MDTEAIRDMGCQLRAAFRRRDYDGRAFPDLAADALSRLSCSIDWDPTRIAELLLTTDVQQEPGSNFSNLPLMLFRCDQFYVELLCWTTSTTAIHEHAFSGAFKVSRGTSIHSTHRFDPTRSISEDLVLGSVRCLDVELLGNGDVRPIVPGPDGSVHSLFHLDHPSLTLVARTWGHARHQPQMTLLRPSVAYSKLGLASRPFPRMLRMLLATARDVSKEQWWTVMCQGLAQVDFPNLLHIFTHEYAHLDSAERFEEFYGHCVSVHGETLIQHLREVTSEMQRVDVIRAARRATQDPDLRLFLALLLNAVDRTSIIRLIRSRYPNEDPCWLCARWLRDLADQKQGMARLLAELSATAGAGEYRLSGRLARVLPAEEAAPESRIDLLHRALNGEVTDLANELRALPELRVLF